MITVDSFLKKHQIRYFQNNAANHMFKLKEEKETNYRGAVRKVHNKEKNSTAAVYLQSDRDSEF